MEFLIILSWIILISVIWISLSYDEKRISMLQARVAKLENREFIDYERIAFIESVPFLKSIRKWLKRIKWISKIF